jgi:hypothetical protein
MSAEVTEAPAAPSEVQDTPSEDKLTVQQHDEVDRLDPLPDKLKLVNGIEFEMQPLKLRQFLAMLRIVTRGATGVLASGGLSSRDGDDFARQLMMLLLFAIPESEEETIEFIGTLVKPVLTGNPEIDDKIVTEFEEAIRDPELEDMALIIQAFVQNEAADLRSLGNRLRSMLSVATKMGLTNDAKTTA